MIEKLVNRFKEPSTYAGLTSAALLFGLTNDQFSVYANSAAGVCAFLAIIVKEVGAEK